VRLLMDMDNKLEVGYIDWEFIHDMQGIAPDLITPEFIFLTNEFLLKIPKKWAKIKSKLVEHTSASTTIHLAISDLENLGDDFKIRGVLKNKQGMLLSFHKVVIYDKDRFEDDYLGSVITDKNGCFSLAFGKKVFSDFGMESEPDIYFKIFVWQENQFVEIGHIMPQVYERSETTEKKRLLEYGVVTL